MIDSELEIRAFISADEKDVVKLWTACGLVVPWNDPSKDISRKRAVQPELFLVGESEKQIIATVMAGYDGHRGWINYLAVHPDERRRGLGKMMMDAAEEHLIALGCPKVNLQVRTGNTEVLEFYRRIGYITDDVVSFGKRLESDTKDN